MATTTTVNKKKVLISKESVTFIRPMNVTVEATLMKPNTKMFAFFDGKDVNRYFQQSGKALGEQMVSDANGNITAVFNIPGMTFNTGARTIVLSEANTLPPDGILTDNAGSASAVFTTVGALEKYQTTETTVNTTTVEEVVRVQVRVTRAERLARADPLAQSFFTFGLDGGCFITSLDLYFQSKDGSAPVWVELREMIAGVPSNTMVHPEAIAVKQAADVNVSQNSSVATNFKFDKLVFLEPDKDYCFVVQARSTQYNMWTCKLSEKSIETGKTVFEQPYNGSLFKSENNYTWTAEQTEDIKFTLYKAEFNTSVIANIDFPLKANNALVDSAQFYTIGGTNKCYVTLPYKHGLDLNSKIDLTVDSTGTFNGVAGSVLTGTFSVTEIVSEYIAAFVVPTATFNGTGPITTGGKIRDTQVTEGGTGYSTITPPTVSFGGPGTGAAGYVVINSSGVITDIIMTNQGSGYTTAPTVSITGAPGSGATATAITDSAFKVRTNRVYHGLNPTMYMVKPQQTDIKSTIDTTLSQFPDGNLVSYTAGLTYDVDLTKMNRFNNNFMLASPSNETANMGGANSAKLNVLLSTTNPNVSPVIDLKDSRMFFINNYINNQTGETILSANEAGYVTGLSIQSGGSGYTENPTVALVGDGTGATATATVVAGVVVGMTVTSIGSGYTKAPTVKFYGGNPAVAATAIATISDFNSEKSIYKGNAKSRYISKAQQLASVSTGARVVVEAYSNGSSSFEVYIRTSLLSTGTPHDSATWTALNCDTERNKSGAVGEFKEYEFYKDGLGDFDMFSIKIVMRSLTPWDPPIIANYRTIIAA